jgi:hypothetical protein
VVGTTSVDEAAIIRPSVGAELSSTRFIKFLHVYQMVLLYILTCDQDEKTGAPPPRDCKNRAFQSETRHDQDKRLDQENKMIRIAQDCGRHGHSVYRKQLIKQQKQSKHTALSSTHILLHLPPQQS